MARDLAALLSSLKLSNTTNMDLDTHNTISHHWDGQKLVKAVQHHECGPGQHTTLSTITEMARDLLRLSNITLWTWTTHNTINHHWNSQRPVHTALLLKAVQHHEHGPGYTHTQHCLSIIKIADWSNWPIKQLTCQAWPVKHLTHQTLGLSIKHLTHQTLGLSNIWPIKDWACQSNIWPIKHWACQSNIWPIKHWACQSNIWPIKHWACQSTDGSKNWPVEGASFMAESGVNFHVAGQMPQHSELLEGIQSLCLKQHKNEHVNIASHFRKQKIN